MKQKIISYILIWLSNIILIYIAAIFAHKDEELSKVLSFIFGFPMFPLLYVFVKVIKINLPEIIFSILLFCNGLIWAYVLNEFVFIKTNKNKSL